MCWRRATVVAVGEESPCLRTLALAVDGWRGHRPGQFIGLRAPTADGRSAARAYTIVSAPGEGLLEITVKRVADGELSPWLVDGVTPGDRLWVRGPMGQSFAWDWTSGDPLVLVGAGLGLLPLMSIERHRRRVAPHIDARLILSARSPADVPFPDDLSGVALTYTRRPPLGWSGYARRIDAHMLADVAPSPGERPRCYICGPSGFAETVLAALRQIGYERAASQALDLVGQDSTDRRIARTARC